MSRAPDNAGEIAARRYSWTTRYTRYSKSAISDFPGSVRLQQHTNGFAVKGMVSHKAHRGSETPGTRMEKSVPHYGACSQIEEVRVARVSEALIEGTEMSAAKIRGSASAKRADLVGGSRRRSEMPQASPVLARLFRRLGRARW